MGLDHDIDANGIIFPSLDCPECDFHDHGKLLNWSEKGNIQ